MMGVNMTWIDHILCSKMLDDSVKDVCVHYDFICSDHKPLSVCFKNLVPKLCATDDSDTVPADRPVSYTHLTLPTNREV